MKKLSCLCLVILLSLFCVTDMLSQKMYHTDIFSSQIKTLKVQVDGNWERPPVIGLQSDEVISIGFDEWSARENRYTYSILHCNSDWTRSSLSSGEYMTGFQNQLIFNYETSYITTMNYTHYQLFFPNEEVNFLVSGNYVVLISEEGHEDKPVLAACFSVVDQQVKTQMQVKTNTDIDFNRNHQQLSVEVNYPSGIFSTMQDFKIYATQNNRMDTRVLLSGPSSMQPGKLVYDHNRNLIFEAGNEYRRFETISTQYNGLNIQSLQFYSPYYHQVLYPDDMRSRKSYIYDEDQNGRFFIRAADSYNPDIEADYVFVHFSLPCERPFPEEIYILSEAFDNLLDERSKMSYNYEEKSYMKTVMLKQGLYNYMYVSKKAGTSKAVTTLVEGNYYQTENEYSLWVYHRPPGGRYDKLIGVQSLKFIQ